MNNECAHVEELRSYLERVGIRIYSEHGEEPQGWVNVHCKQCGRTFETTLRLPAEGA